MSKLARVVASLEPRHKLLAKKSGLSEERIREIARGDEPQVSEVISLSKALSMPLASLMDKGAGPEQVEFRFRTAAKAKAAESPFYVEDMASRVSGFIEIISCADVSEESRGWRQQVPTGLSPESLASWCRAALLEVDEVSPIPGLPRILANKLGFVVAEVGYPEVEGASAFIDEVPFIFVSRRFAPRMLFTVAHELGHLLVHHGAGDFVAIDRRQGDERARVRGEEGFADQFASAILLPAAGVGVALRVLRESYEIDEDAVGDIELLYLSRLFGVSFLTAAIRCERLGLLPSGGAQSLYEHLVKNHGGPEKRAAELELPARNEPDFPVVSKPTLTAIERCLATGRMSLGRIVENLRLPLADLLVANRAPAH